MGDEENAPLTADTITVKPTVKPDDRDEESISPLSPPA